MLTYNHDSYNTALNISLLVSVCSFVLMERLPWAIAYNRLRESCAEKSTFLSGNIFCHQGKILGGILLESGREESYSTPVYVLLNVGTAVADSFVPLMDHDFVLTRLAACKSTSPPTHPKQFTVLVIDLPMKLLLFRSLIKTFPSICAKWMYSVAAMKVQVPRLQY